jgi:5,10-methenyltetrahydromethanopterin hydrogenase
MIETVTTAAKLKVIIAVLSLLIIGSVYSATEETVISQTMELKDPYVTDIQARADLVENAVMEAVNQQGKMSALQYKQSCESSMHFIRGEMLDTEIGYNTLDRSQKELTQDYRAYLEEAAVVVVVCYEGGEPDLTAMHAAKQKLN